jgi:predicted alpha/beta superfamily hydrolase
MRKSVLLALSLAVMVLSASAREKSHDIKIGEAFSLRSKVLNEERVYWVSLPQSYNDGSPARLRYPVLYLLDGDAHFNAASGVVQFMSGGVNRNLQIPEMIVVAVLNTDRTRDMTPTHSLTSYEGKEAAYLGASGGGDAFLKFLKDELFPRVDSTYRTLPYRILVGHSLGGLLTLYALAASPEMFNAYLAIDPSLWWDNQVVFRRAEGRLKGATRPRASVYISMANTPGFESGDPNVAGATRRFARLLQSASPDIRCSLQYFEAENHGSVPLVSLYYGLLNIFDGYKLMPDADRQRPSDLSDHFKRQSERLGVTLLPPEATVNGMGYYLLYQAKNVDKAIEFFKLNVTNYPDSANAYDSLGEAYAVKGEKALAIENFERSLKLNPANESAAKKLQELRGREEHK